jgi:YtkA-like
MLLRMAQPQRRVPGLAAAGLAAWLLLAASMSGACTRQPAAEDTTGVLVTTRLLPPQPTVGPATLTITLSGATADTLGGSTVQVVGHMTHPGMTPVVATVTPRGPDVYDAALDFTMPGDWLLIATVRLRDGRRLESRVPVQVQPRQP